MIVALQRASSRSHEAHYHVYASGNKFDRKMLEFHGVARENGENSRRKLRNVVADSTDETEGDTARDHCGNGHHGRYIGWVRFGSSGPASGGASRALQLDGRPGHVCVKLDAFRGVTIECWVRRDGRPRCAVQSRGNTGVVSRRLALAIQQYRPTRVGCQSEAGLLRSRIWRFVFAGRLASRRTDVRRRQRNGAVLHQREKFGASVAWLD